MTQTIPRSIRRLAVTGALLGAFLAFATSGAYAENTVSAQSFGTLVDTPLVSQAQTPVAILDPADGLADDALAGVDLAGTLTTNTLETLASGTVAENAATSQSSSTAQDVNILGGRVTAKGDVAMANSQANGVMAVSNAVGSTIFDLAVNGVSMGDTLPAPNTRVAVPVVGTVVLNEQVPSGDGITDTALTVNMIHVILQDALTGATLGNVIVGSAASGATFTR